MNRIRAASVQFQHLPGDKQANLRIVESFVDKAVEERADLVVFPEMCLTGYWHVRNLDKAGVEALAEPVPDGPLSRALLALSSEKGLTIGAGLIERGDDGLNYNTYLVAMPDGRFAKHRKPEYKSLRKYSSNHRTN